MDWPPKAFAERRKRALEKYTYFFTGKVTPAPNSNPNAPEGGKQCTTTLLSRSPAGFDPAIENVAREEFLPVPDTVRQLVQKAMVQRQIERRRRDDK